MEKIKVCVSMRRTTCFLVVIRPHNPTLGVVVRAFSTEHLANTMKELLECMPNHRIDLLKWLRRIDKLPHRKRTVETLGLDKFILEALALEYDMNHIQIIHMPLPEDMAVFEFHPLDEKE